MRQIQKTVKLRIPTGRKDVTESFKMPTGFVKSMVVYTNDYKKDYPQNLELALMDDASVEVIPMNHIDHFRQSNGEYEKSFKPLNFDSENRSFALTLKSDVESGANFSDPIVWVTFLMDTNVR